MNTTTQGIYTSQSNDRYSFGFLRMILILAISVIGSVKTRAADNLLDVTPSMLSGPLNFFASPAGLTFAAPIPYGVANNVADTGWIWPQDNSGYLNVDFGADTALSRVRAWVSYAGGARGVVWTFSYSDDGASFIPLFDYTFESALGAGVNDDGTHRTDFGGWYEAKFNEDGAQSHRYWQIVQTVVTITHQPRVAQLQFFTPQIMPTVQSVFPNNVTIKGAVPIEIALQDEITAVKASLIVLSINGTEVTPTIEKADDSPITKISYTPIIQLPNGTNIVRIVFGNDATPSVFQTNEFNFVLNYDPAFIPVTPSMLSGSLNFLASPANLTFANPIPYGQVNNDFDAGWIWPNDNSGYLDIDFGKNTPLSSIRSYVTYNGASRGALWSIQFSDDDATWNEVLSYNFQTAFGSGVNSDGSPRSDYGGWYTIRFNQTATESHRYWRIQQTAVTAGNAPRIGQMEFFTPLGLPSVHSIFPRNVTVKGAVPVQIALQDELTAVKASSIVLSINGINVTPIIEKAAGSTITTITYTPIAQLPDGTNTVSLVFGNEATPSILQTNDFSFVLKYDSTFIPVTPQMLSGPLNFLASPPDLTFANPIPYGQANNTLDVGWIWPNDNSGYLDIDFGGNTPLSRIRSFVTFPGAARGATWSIQFSDDQTTWTEILSYTFQSRFGGGLNDDGSVRADYAGWYEARFNQTNTETHRYWRIQQTGVTASNAPRVGQMEFFTQLALPSAVAFSPSGTTTVTKPPISIDLEDNLSTVDPSTIVLSVNGTAVNPTISKPAGSITTTISYNTSQQLRNGINTVRIVFGNDENPSILSTNDFTFFIIGDPSFLPVTPDMLSGPLSFYASPAGLAFGLPVPYGVPNNLNDVGWIWPQNNSGYMNIDFGKDTALSRLREYVTYAGAARGVVWTISYSDDGASFTPLYDYTFESKAGGGVNDDGTIRSDFGGWYETKFNIDGTQAHRYWQIAQTAVTLTHQPRVGQMEFYMPTVLPTVASVSPTGTSVSATAPIDIHLDDALSAVNTNSIILLVNGTAVAPAITKADGSFTTDIFYAGIGERVNGTNTVRLVFGNNANPSVLQTNEFTFVLNLVTGPVRLQTDDADGLLVLEAEHFAFQRPGTAATTPPNEIWTPVTAPSGFSGEGAMQALPNDPNLNMGALPDSETIANSPRMDYNVKFVKSGTNYIWIRGLADSAPGASIDDSLHVGLDGQLLELSKTISGFPQGAGYVWASGAVARFENVTAGTHVVNVWMRENGMIFDKMVITSNPNYVPTATGPDESPFGVLQQNSGADGLLVFEAEFFDSQRPGTDATVPPNEIWTLVTGPGGFSGAGAMQALPNDPNLNMGTLPDGDTVLNSPRMDYNVTFVAAGTNYIWVRGLADSAPGASIDDSLHLGLDGQLLATSKAITGFPQDAGYVWSSGAIARFENVTPGAHVINVWMRENGMICDKILITSNPSYVPNGFGPDETRVAPAVGPRIGFTRQGNALTLSWTGSGILQSADKVEGPYLDVPER